MKLNISNIKEQLPKLNIDEIKESDYSYNKNKKVYITFAILTLIILFIGSFLIYRNASKNQDKEENVLIASNVLIDSSELTPETVARLQNYPFSEGKEPIIGFQQRTEDDLYYAECIMDIFINSKIIIFEDNEKFFTSKKLAYTTKDCNYAVRGIYQVNLKDGSTTKQDVEFTYAITGWSDDRTNITVLYKGMKELSKPI